MKSPIIEIILAILVILLVYLYIVYIYQNSTTYLGRKATNLYLQLNPNVKSVKLQNIVNNTDSVSGTVLADGKVDTFSYMFGNCPLYSINCIPFTYY